MEIGRFTLNESEMVMAKENRCRGSAKVDDDVSLLQIGGRTVLFGQPRLRTSK